LHQPALKGDSRQDGDGHDERGRQQMLEEKASRAKREEQTEHDAR
jgi:hypothetical protein